MHSLVELSFVTLPASIHRYHSFQFQQQSDVFCCNQKVDRVLTVVLEQKNSGAYCLFCLSNLM